MSATHWPTLDEIGLTRRAAPVGDLPLDGALVTRRWAPGAAGATVTCVDPRTGEPLGDAAIALACCALGGDRLLWVAPDRALRSRRARGGPTQAHGRVALRSTQRACTLRAGEGIAVIVELEDEGAVHRVTAIELEGGAARWSLRAGWIAWASVEAGSVWLLERDLEDDRSMTLLCVDPRTGAARWRWDFEGEGDPEVERSGPLAWVVGAQAIAGSVVAIDVASGAARWTLDEGRVVGRCADRALVARPWRSLDVRDARAGALLARFAAPLGVLRTCAIDERRAAVSTRDALWVLDVIAGEVLAAERIGQRGTQYPRLDASGSLLVHEPRERWLRDRRVARSQEELRAIPAREPRRARWDAALERDEPPAVELSVDRARLAEIEAVLREEAGDRDAAWERLCVRSVIDPRFDRERWSLIDRREPTRARSIGAWCALAHDSGRLSDAQPLCDELRHALGPWVGPLPERVSLALDGGSSWSSLRQLDQWLRALLSEIVQTRWPDEGTRAALLALESSWRRAADEGLCFAQTAPEALAGAPVAARRSPAAPWLALLALGLEPSFGDDGLALAYVPMNDALDGRAQSEDIAF